MTIPSNLTVREFAHYFIASASREEIEQQFYKLLDELELARSQCLANDRLEEVLREQISFAKCLVTSIQDQAVANHKTARKNSKEWNLANFVINEIENSYFEL